MASNPAPLPYDNAVLLCECDDLSMMSEAQWESLEASCRKYRLELPDKNKRRRIEVEIQAPALHQDIQVTHVTHPGVDPFGQGLVLSSDEESDNTANEQFMATPEKEETPEPWVALSDLWPNDTCTYSTKIAKREGEAVAILAIPAIPSNADLRPFQGWTPPKERFAKISEDQPRAAVVSLLLASWLRDADAPLDIFRAISTASVIWASTRHKALWMYVDFEASWILPRPTVRVRDPQEIDPWNYIEATPPKENVVGWLHLPSVAPLCDLAGIPLQDEEEPTQDRLQDAGLRPLLLKIDDLPGVCYNGR